VFGVITAKTKAADQSGIKGWTTIQPHRSLASEPFPFQAQRIADRCAKKTAENVMKKIHG
jgi:hypothetical protein